MKNLLLVVLFATLFSCKNKGQVLDKLDKVPLDTTDWSLTESYNINFNNDSIDDVILVFDKYKHLTRPDNIQTPILFYLGKKNNTFSFITKGEKLIFSPYYNIIISGRTMIITQNGIGDDNKIYLNYYTYSNDQIIIYKELVLQKIEKLKVDENSGDVTKTVVRTDTLYKNILKTPADKYDVLKLRK